MVHNFMKLEISAVSQNESFARVTVAAFAAQLDPTVDEITELKTAVSEAVTNSIVHGYNGGTGKIVLEVGIKDMLIDIKVIDFGSGIGDIDMALQPFYTTKADDEHSGMGFTLMDSFMNKLEVQKNKPSGLIVHMQKEIKK